MIAQKRWKEVLSFGGLAILSCVLIVLPGLAIASVNPISGATSSGLNTFSVLPKATPSTKPRSGITCHSVAGSLPWLALLPGALRLGWREKHPAGGGLYLLGWVVMPLLFFSIAKGKLPTYILPCFAPLAILMARYACLAAEKGPACYASMPGSTAFGTLGVIAALVVSPWGWLSTRSGHRSSCLKSSARWWPSSSGPWWAGLASDGASSAGGWRRCALPGWRC